MLLEDYVRLSSFLLAQAPTPVVSSEILLSLNCSTLSPNKNECNESHWVVLQFLSIFFSVFKCMHFSIFHIHVDFSLASFAGGHLWESREMKCFFQRQSRPQMWPSPTSEPHCPESGALRAREFASAFFLLNTYFLPGLIVFCNAKLFFLQDGSVLWGWR